MTKFLNLRNGKITLSYSRACDAEVTSRDDLIESFENASQEILCAIAEDGDEHYADNEILDF